MTNETNPRQDIDHGAADVRLPDAPRPASIGGGTEIGTTIRDPAELRPQERQLNALRAKRAKGAIASAAGRLPGVNRAKKKWKLLRAQSVYEMAKGYQADGTIRDALEMMRQVWQEGLLVQTVWDEETKVFKEVIVQVKDQRLRMETLNDWLDRLLGKPVQQIEKDAGDDPALRSLQNALQRFESVAKDRNAALVEITRARVAVGGQAGAADPPARLPG